MEWVRIFASEEEACARVDNEKPRLVVLRGRRICLVRRKGEFFAVQDACSHNSESLSKGSVNYLGEIICPLHGYRFDLMSGRESSERSRDLETYPVRVDGTGFFIGI